MESRFEKSTIRDLALAIGLASVLSALVLVCAAESAPPTAASPTRGDLWPVWTSTDPVTKEVGVGYTPWVIDPYSVTIVFRDGALKESAVFTFAPRMDLEFDPPLRATPYMFELSGYLVSTGKPVSLWKAIEYNLRYEDSALGDIEESTLDAYREDDVWDAQNAILDTVVNRITWNTEFTGKFGIAGYGPRTNTYLPAMYSSSARSFTEAELPPPD